MHDFRILELAAAVRKDDAKHELTLALAKVQLQAASAEREVTVEFLLACMPAPASHLFWRVVTWNTIFGVADEAIQRMSDEERTIAHFRTHYGRETALIIR